MANNQLEKFQSTETDEIKCVSENESIPHSWRPNKTTIEELSSPSTTKGELIDCSTESTRKISNEKRLEFDEHSTIRRKELQRQVAYGARLQGNIGEGIALRTATDKLGFSPDSRFDQSTHGFDAVYHDENNIPVIIESKFDNRGIQALRKDQMQPNWIESNAIMMQMPENERFTVGNAEIGHEILAKGGDKVRRIVIITDPKSLDTKAYEGQVDRSWKLLGSWSSFDLEQPYLE